MVYTEACREHEQSHNMGPTPVRFRVSQRPNEDGDDDEDHQSKFALSSSASPAMVKFSKSVMTGTIKDEMFK